jgi:hypothetical protein
MERLRLLNRRLVEPSRWGFSGRVARDVEDRYLGKEVTEWLPRGAQTPLRYINCD